MNTEIANALFRYLETLYNLNQKIIKLCGINIIDDFDNSERDVLDIIQDIPRIVPYSYNNSTKKLEFKSRDGLLEYSQEIQYLKLDYQNILDKNYEFLNNIRIIRNKYEHKMHGIKHQSSGSGSLSLFNFTFEVDGELLKINSDSFIELFKNLNCLFFKIVNDIKNFAEETGKNNYRYYHRITRFDFLDFNKIYDSVDLRTIGLIMRKF